MNNLFAKEQNYGHHGIKDMGTYGINSSHFLTIYNLVKFRIFGKFFGIPKDYFRVHQSVKSPANAITERRYDNYPAPIFDKRI